MNFKFMSTIFFTVLLVMSIPPTGSTEYSGFPFPPPNGRIPLYLMGPPTPEKMEIAKLSKVVEIEPIPWAISELRNEGVKLIFYDWIFARYSWEVKNWNASDFLVKFQGPYGTAFAYDYGDERVRQRRAKEIVEMMLRYNYSGVFFDWFPVVCDIELAQESAPGYVEEFFKEHPDETLEEALLLFIKELRSEAKKAGVSIIIVSNQAYRCGPKVMAAVDWDISESYFTDIINGSTVLFPWETGNWDSPATYVPDVVNKVYSKAKELNFKLGFTHINYALPGDINASYYAYAGSRIFDEDGIVTTPSEINETATLTGIPNVYWLGCFREKTNSSNWAFASYDLGFVAVGDVPFKVPPKFYGVKVYDLKTKRVIRLRYIGNNGTWGNVYLRLPKKEGIIIDDTLHSYHPILSVPIWSSTTGGVIETLAYVENYSVYFHDLNLTESIKKWGWKEPSNEVVIVANDIDWNLSGVVLANNFTAENISVYRASLTFPGLEKALLDTKLVIVLGGNKSPITGHILLPLTSKLNGTVSQFGPDRFVIWLWGDDRYLTRESVLSNMGWILKVAKSVLSPLPKCPEKLTKDY